MFDQRMFHWVNEHQLPFSALKPQLIKLISDLFGGVMVPMGKCVWDPAVNSPKTQRVLLMGKAVTGKEVDAVKPKPASDNAFDVDAGCGKGRSESRVALAASAGSKVVNNGAILNQFKEPLRAVQDCMVLDLDKKQLKKLCMLLRWKFFGVGAANRGLEIEGSHLVGISNKPIDYRNYSGLQVCVNDLEGGKPMGLRWVCELTVACATC